MDIVKSNEERYWEQIGFEKGVFSERVRLIAYLVENGIIRMDAFGYWVRDTMGDQVTELPDLEPDVLPKRADERVSIHRNELGAMLVRNNKANDARVRDRLIALRGLSDAGSRVSIAISEWVKEIG
jgi:hypothetical protein